MADALLSALASTLLDNLNSLSREEIGNTGKLKAEIQNLESILTTIQAVLQDAEAKQLKSEAIKNWLVKLKDAAYTLEDVLDEFQTETLRRSLHKDARSQVSTFFSLKNPLLFRLNMAHKFKNVREKLDAIAGEKTKFHLREGVGGIEIQPKEERQTSSLVNESEVYGRANEKEMIVGMLLSNLSHHDNLSVYAICGMGGLGKTTIAQLVYNDEKVIKAFDLRLWVCISDDFDIKRLTKAILESIEGNSCNIQELDPLQRRLEEKLGGKRFLLVLDDVWNEHEEKWDGLKQALRRGVKGSTVIVTTRNEKVALMMATVDHVCRLGCLSDDDSWSLFKQRAFGMGRNEDNARLETIGRQIVKKCGGVPLAIKVIGSMMRLKSQESEWQHVKDSEIWDVADEGSRIIAVLRLSYEHLPPYLRQCFSFCSIFPKDYVMTKQELIELWMANGFIPSRGPLDLHEMGCEIFNELTWRSFFQETKEDIDGNVTCKMHDLIHDVAASIKRDECCVIEADKMLKIPKATRHLYVCSSSSPTILDSSKLQSLRSLILEGNISLSNPSHFAKQKYLKVLNLGYLQYGTVDYLSKHLRYLNLSSSNIKGLPESTSGLYNLQTLNLRYCSSLQMLPKGMKNLKNLHYLDIKYCCELACMPVGLANLSCLHKLSMFIVGMDEGVGINELKELALEGELSIKALYNVKSSAEAKNAKLIEKPNLRSLSLSWRRINREESSEQENAEEILNGLQPHSNLKKLCIIDYQGWRFPSWMMDLLLPNLVVISLDNCERCDQLPPLGKLRFLKELSILGMRALKSIDSNFYGDGESSFPSLERLEISYADCLEEWTAVDGRDNFPLLSSLSIRGCPKLVKLPMLKFLKELVIEGTSVTSLSSVIMNAIFLTSLRFHFDGLTELPDGLLQNQKHLNLLSIVSMSLKSLSNQLDNLSSLKKLSLECCLELESLPAGLQNLSSLERLDLNQCNSFVIIPANVLRGLSSLSSLWILRCKKLSSLSDGVRYLTSLQELFISGCPELTSLPESIQHLSSLRSLRIWHCKGLISLPNEIQHLTLLSDLWIRNCPNLMCLPQGMKSLTALKELTIDGCPHLEKRCQKERGEDWPNIAHIPSIIYNPWK